MLTMGGGGTSVRAGPFTLHKQDHLANGPSILLPPSVPHDLQPPATNETPTLGSPITPYKEEYSYRRQSRATFLPPYARSIHTKPRHALLQTRPRIGAHLCGPVGP